MKLRIASTVVLVLLSVSCFAFGFTFTPCGGWGQDAQRGLVDLLPSLSWSTNAWEAGSIDVGDAATTTLTISNTGNDIAEDVTTSVTGAGFRLYSSTTFGNISSGRTRTARVAFTPTGAGAFSGYANYSAPNIGRTSVALSGTGVGEAPTTPITLNAAVKPLGYMVGGQILTATVGTWYQYSPVTVETAGTVANGHYNTYRNAVGATSTFYVYSVSGDTATPVCSGPAQAGNDGQPQLHDVALSGCNVGTGTIFVGVCLTDDASTTNSVYLTNAAGGTGNTYGIKMTAACGESFSVTAAGAALGNRAAFVWGDNSATR